MEQNDDFRRSAGNHHKRWVGVYKYNTRNNLEKWTLTSDDYNEASTSYRINSRGIDVGNPLGTCMVTWYVDYKSYNTGIPAP